MLESSAIESKTYADSGANQRNGMQNMTAALEKSTSNNATASGAHN
jgi:hypothetical protein